MRSAIASPCSTTLQGSDFLAAAVSLAQNVGPVAVALPPTNVDAGIELEKTASADDKTTTLTNIAEFVKDVALSQDKKESGDESSLPSSDADNSDEPSSNSFAGFGLEQDLTKSFFEAAGELEALYRVLERVTKDYSHVIPTQHELPEEMVEQIEEIGSMKVNEGWLEKAIDVDINDLLSQCRKSGSQEQPAEDEAGSKLEEEEKQAVIDPEVKNGFQSYVESVVEKFEAFFDKFREAKKTEIKKSIESLPRDQQVDKLVDKIVNSLGLVMGSRLVQAKSEKFRILNALKGIRRTFDSQNVPEEEPATTSEEN